jgi:hypothetical protein
MTRIFSISDNWDFSESPSPGKLSCRISSSLVVVDLDMRYSPPFFLWERLNLP